MKRLFRFNLNHRVSTFVLSVLITVLFAPGKLFSNNLTVSIVGTPDQTNGLVTFDISWQNSWRDVGTVAKNWDAAWVFIKWRDCSLPNNNQWTHGIISTNTADHTFNGTGGGGSTTFEPTLSDGSAAGIDASPNNTGVMLRGASSTTYYGSVNSRVTLKVTNLAGVTGSLNVKVFGIEMVYVASGTYFLGDGNGSLKSTGSFSSTVSGNTSQQISGETSITVNESSSTICPSSSCALGDKFQKGYNPFYIMKYEITQGAYCDFLNSIPSIAQTIHYTAVAAVTPWNYNTNRHTINRTQDATGRSTFTVDRPYRACNFLSWADVGSFLAWAALRPLTELEFEKACRGSGNSVPYETAFGQTSATRAAIISTGAETGTETITTAGANICDGGAFTSGGDGATGGPLRGGIFSTPSGNNTRILTGGSFFGVMELTGNVEEYYVSALAGTTQGPSYNGLNSGTGMLIDSTGNFGDLSWPHPLYPGTTTSNTYYLARKGGTWNTTNTVNGTLPVSLSYRTSSTSVIRDNGSGGRGGRSAPVAVVTTPQTFNYTGAVQYFIVPPGVTSVTIDAYGAQGGGPGANGGRITGALAVTPGQLLYLYVGQQGQIGTGGGGLNSAPVNPPTGGNAGVAAAYGGGAGTEVRTGAGGPILADRIIIAGGGGGGSSNTAGIGGGGTSGLTGFDKWYGGAGGNGASVNGSNGGSAGGSGGTCSPSCGAGGGGGGYTGGGTGGIGSGFSSANTGTQSAGGSGVYYTTTPNASSCGGGGGGHWGGGGGWSYSSNAAGGGGGTSAALGAGWSGVTNNVTTNTGNGKIIINW